MSEPNNPLKVKSQLNLVMSDSAITPATLTDIVSETLRRNWASVRHAPKHLARQINTNVRTAVNLMEGNHAPSAATLVKLMAADDEIFEAVLSLAGRDLPPSHEQIKAIKAAIAIMEGKQP